jgi:hypothetical protein
MSQDNKGQLIHWSCAPLQPEVLKKLQERSNLMGLVQTFADLGMLGTTGGLALDSLQSWPWWATALLVFAHGTVFAFPGWIHHQMLAASHTRRHRSTQHSPDGLELVLPEKFLIKHFLKRSFINIERIRWARTRVVGRALIFTACLGLGFSFWRGFFLLPVLIRCGSSFGQRPLLLCNSIPHIGLQDNVPHFRRCCRTFALNPFVRILDWRMNFDINPAWMLPRPVTDLANSTN